MLWVIEEQDSNKDSNKDSDRIPMRIFEKEILLDKGYIRGFIKPLDITFFNLVKLL